VDLLAPSGWGKGPLQSELEGSSACPSMELVLCTQRLWAPGLLCKPPRQGTCSSIYFPGFASCSPPWGTWTRHQTVLPQHPVQVLPSEPELPMVPGSHLQPSCSQVGCWDGDHPSSLQSYMSCLPFPFWAWGSPLAPQPCGTCCCERSLVYTAW
jgi:hypothetical protein